MSNMLNINSKRKKSPTSKLYLDFAFDHFAIETNDATVSNPLAELFARNASRNPRYYDKSYTKISIRHDSGSFAIECLNETKYLPTLNETLYWTMRHISDSFVRNNSESMFVMHAASASVEGRGVAFAGSSGSGKTSLALAFSKHDGFLGDECAYINKNTCEINHELFPFQLKGSNSDLISTLDNKGRMETYDNAIGTAFYYPLDAIGTVSPIPLPLAFIVFPRFVASKSDFRISRYPICNLPGELLESLIGPGPPAITSREFLRMCSRGNVRFYQVTYSNVFDDARRLYEYLKEQE